MSLASAAAVASIPDGTAYASSKTALVRFTETVDKEVDGTGVSAFAIDPGNVATGMHEFLGSSPAWLRRRGGHRAEFTPAERSADLVLRLAAGHADALIGRLISVVDAVDDLVKRADAIRQDDLYTPAPAVGAVVGSALADFKPERAAGHRRQRHRRWRRRAPRQPGRAILCCLVDLPTASRKRQQTA